MGVGRLSLIRLELLLPSCCLPAAFLLPQRCLAGSATEALKLSERCALVAALYLYRTLVVQRCVYPLPTFHCSVGVGVESVRRLGSKSGTRQTLRGLEEKRRDEMGVMVTREMRQR